jgi:hypothetical protein
MLPEKWSDVVGRIKDSFEVSDTGKIELEEEGGMIIEFIEFMSPMGRTRLEFVKKPVILDRITNYSNRIGSDTNIKYVYSKDEFSHVMIAYKWDEAQSDWSEMEGNMFA